MLLKQYIDTVSRVLVYIRHRQALVQLHLAALRLHCGHGLFLAQFPRLVIADQHKVVRNRLAALLDAVLFGLLRRDRSKIDQQTLFDAKHGIRRLVRITAEVERAVSRQYAQPAYEQGL